MSTEDTDMATMKNDEKAAPESQPDSADGGEVALQRSTATTDSIWVASTLPLYREAPFVALVCMAQFCTRTFVQLCVDRH